MATQLNNKFTSFDLTPEEFKAGTILSLPQIQVLQNSLSEVALQKVELVYDPLNPVDFAQQVAYLQGKIDVLSLLIENSKAMELSLLEEAQFNRAVQQ